MPRTPLAWYNLTHDRVRFALFVLGVVFAVVLMFMQLGFRGALLDSNSLLHERIRADLVLVSPNRSMLPMREPFSRRRLIQAEAVPGVRSVHPLYIDNGAAVLRNTDPDPDRRGPSRAVRVVGVDPDAFLLDFPELDPSSPRYLGDRIQAPGTALFDRKSHRDPDDPTRSIFGPLVEGARTELAGQNLILVGGFDLGPDFTSEGMLIVSAETFADLLRRPVTLGAPLADVDLGLIRLEPGADVEAVRDAIRREIARGSGGDPEVNVLTVPELIEREHRFWLGNTPIGFAFVFGMFMGFAVGTVICYQILSGDVSDHLAEYATLKAFGYRNWDLAWVVIQEALILAVAGYVVGLGLSWLAYGWLTEASAMPLRMTVGRALIVFAVTVGMCILSGLIALVRLVRADPADVFG
jgi:putative ABC transport system permease protein